MLGPPIMQGASGREGKDQALRNLQPPACLAQSSQGHTQRSPPVSGLLHHHYLCLFGRAVLFHSSTVSLENSGWGIVITLPTSLLTYLSLPPPDLLKSIHEFRGKLGVKLQLQS